MVWRGVHGVHERTAICKSMYTTCVCVCVCVCVCRRDCCKIKIRYTIIQEEKKTKAARRPSIIRDEIRMQTRGGGATTLLRVHEREARRNRSQLR